MFDRRMRLTYGVWWRCGGGGSSQPQSKVVSTNVFNLKAAFASFASTPFQKNYGVTVVKNGLTASGSGSITQGSPQSATFEGVSGFKVVTTSLGSVSLNGSSTSLDGSGTDYYDTNYNYLGTDSASGYTVVDGQAAFPTAVKVGDTGELFTAKQYSNSTKSSMTETRKATYLIEADTATTAILSVIYVDLTSYGTKTSQSTDQYRISSNNKLTLIKSVLNSYTNSTLWTAIY